jgi:hypothetical protein
VTNIVLAADAIFTNDGVLRPDKDTNVMWIGIPYSNNGPITVQGITFIGSQSLFPATHNAGGLVCWGNGCLVKDVKVKQLRGHPVIKDVDPLGFEVFGIACRNAQSGPWLGPDGGDVIEDCEVSGCADHAYLSAIYPGFGSFGRSFAITTIQRCTVDGGSRNHAAFSANVATHYKDCTARGFANGLYNDTSNVSDVIMENCTIDCNYAGVNIVGVPNKGTKKENIQVRGCTFNITPLAGAEAIGMALVEWEGDHTAMNWQNILMSDCRIEMLGGVRLTVLTMWAARVAAVRVNGCVWSTPAYQNIASPTPNPTDFYYLCGNHTIDGTYVPAALPPLPPMPPAPPTPPLIV